MNAPARRTVLGLALVAAALALACNTPADDAFKLWCSDHADSGTPISGEGCQDTSECCPGFTCQAGADGGQQCLAGNASGNDGGTQGQGSKNLGSCDSFAATCKSDPNNCFYTKLTQNQTVPASAVGGNGQVWISIPNVSGAPTICFTHNVDGAQRVALYKGFSGESYGSPELVLSSTGAYNGQLQAAFDTQQLNAEHEYVQVELAQGPAIRGQLIAWNEEIYVAGFNEGMFNGSVQFVINGDVIKYGTNLTAPVTVTLVPSGGSPVDGNVNANNVQTGYFNGNSGLAQALHNGSAKVRVTSGSQTSNDTQALQAFPTP